MKVWTAYPVSNKFSGDYNMKSFSLFSSSAAMIAALSMAAAPAAAAELPARTSHAAAPGYSVWNADSVNVNRDRYRGRHHRDGINAGDVIGGLLVIGAIAAVASAVSKPSQPRSYPAPYPNRSSGYRGDSRYNGSQGIDRAADMCVREIERDVRVNGVDAVERSGDGWLVSGSLYNGDGFTCRVGQDGRIDDVKYGERGAQQSNYSQQEDRQWTDDRYAAAWGNAGPSAPSGGYSDNTPVPSAQAPAYPGGPVPGENYEDEPDYPAGQDDRYGG